MGSLLLALAKDRFVVLLSLDESLLEQVGVWYYLLANFDHA